MLARIVEGGKIIRKTRAEAGRGAKSKMRNDCTNTKHRIHAEHGLIVVLWPCGLLILIILLKAPALRVRCVVIKESFL